LDKEIKAIDLFWAGMDASIAMSTVKAFRAVKMARAGEAVRGAEVAGQAVQTGKMLGSSSKELSLLKRSKLFASRLIPNSVIGRTILKGGALGGIIYVIGTHPGLLNSIFAEVAKILGVNPFLVQVSCWTILIYVLCWPLIPVIRGILPLLIKGLSLLGNALYCLHKLFERAEPKRVEVIEPV
ncbi:MAG: hypothetical protein Q8J76_08380, partial [Desulfobulbaceae bacterium]|nr:hypothetical protein [Desulfobulbaceae bacterium]